MKDDCSFRKYYGGGYVCHLVSYSLKEPCECPEKLCEKAIQIMGFQRRKDGDA